MNEQMRMSGQRAELAGLQVPLSLIKLIAKHNFNPNEPRIPAGQPGGGRWTGGSIPVGVRRGQSARASGRPPNAVTYRTSDGASFDAPPQADFRKILHYGQTLRGKPLVDQIKPIGEAVGQRGKFDFQRQGDRFVRDYTNASNYGVGVLMYGAGHTWLDTLMIGSLYGLFHSSPAYDPDRLIWWHRGYDGARKGSLARAKAK